MNDQAMRARENAISFEVKKDGLQQRQSGDWVLRLTVQAVDMDQRITTAQMGTRFVCVLVEINDDETAVDHKMIAQDKWRQLGPARQAGIRCKDPVFRAFLKEVRFFEVTDEETAADVVRQLCRVASRADLDKVGNSASRLLWHDLDNEFQGWRVKENA